MTLETMTQIEITHLPPAGFRRTPWKNGGGITIDIADAYGEGIVPGSWQGMIWRFGRTAIVAPGPFSDLTGFERLQMVVKGDGLVLDGPNGEIDLRRPFEVVRYDGGLPLVSRLENGPVEVLNLMADRALCDVAMQAITTGQRHELSQGRHVLYAPDASVSGTVGEQKITLDAGHALTFETSSAADLIVNQGVAVVATIAAKA